MTTNTEVVCFDLGGVLARICHTWQDALSAAGYSPKREGLAPDARLQSFEQFDVYQKGEIDEENYGKELSRFLGDLGQEAALEVHKSIIDRPYAGIEALLGRLAEQNVTVCGISNTNRLHWEAFTQEAKFRVLNESIDHWVASHEVGCHKPDPEIFRLIEDRYGVKGPKILFLDDTQINVYGARQLGWNAHRIEPEVDTTATQIRRILDDYRLL
jgi:HAD superfamily hydrolase (TIGR01509 family)